MALQGSDLVKLFVLVPAGTTGFNGQSVSASSSKIYFEVDSQTLWAKGVGYGISDTLKQQISSLATAVGASTDTANADGSLYARIAAAVATLGTLQGTDTGQSIRAIAQNVVDTAFGVADDDNVINKVNEVLAWFADVAETETGQALIQSVADNKTAIGTPAEYYTAEDEAENSEHVAGTVKTPATGLYLLIQQQVAGKNVAAEGDTYVTAYTNVNEPNKVYVAATSALTSAVTNANNALQGITIAGTALTKTTNEITTATLKTAILGDLSGNSNGDNNGVSVTVSYSGGTVSGVTVDASTLANRVTTLEEFNPWEEYQAPSQEPEP